MTKRKIDLKLMFEGLQNQMIAQLNANRDFITHPGSKGDALENTWIEWLRKYLPNRYSVDKAIVIDSTGATSHQLDIVIYDQWFTPFIFKQNGFQYVPAEGVYAVFEVKPDIKGNVKEKSFIEYAGEKIESVRKLKRTTTHIINAGQRHEPRSLTKILGGILASENTYSQMSIKTIEKQITKLEGFQSLDIGCIANYGSFYVDYDGEEDNKIENLENRFNDYYKSKRKYRKVVFSQLENSLVSFFLQLTRYLQQAIGTVAAIDLNEYAKTINFTIDKDL